MQYHELNEKLWPIIVLMNPPYTREEFDKIIRDWLREKKDELFSARILTKSCFDETFGLKKLSCECGETEWHEPTKEWKWDGRYGLQLSRGFQYCPNCADKLGDL